MKWIAIIAATAAMLVTAFEADAQGRGDGYGRNGRGDDRRVEQRYDRGGRGERGEGRPVMPRYDPDAEARRRNDPRNAAPAYAPPRSWRRGESLPPMYRNGYVRDLGRNRLRAPPPGYDWVGVGGDIYLVQRSTGMVLDSIPGGY